MLYVYRPPFDSIVVSSISRAPPLKRPLQAHCPALILTMAGFLEHWQSVDEPIVNVEIVRHTDNPGRRKWIPTAVLGIPKLSGAGYKLPRHNKKTQNGAYRSLTNHDIILPRRHYI